MEPILKHNGNIYNSFVVLFQIYPIILVLSLASIFTEFIYTSFISKEIYLELWFILINIILFWLNIKKFIQQELTNYHVLCFWGIIYYCLLIIIKPFNADLIDQTYYFSIIIVSFVIPKIPSTALVTYRILLSFITLSILVGILKSIFLKDYHVSSFFYNRNHFSILLFLSALYFWLYRDLLKNDFYKYWLYTVLGLCIVIIFINGTRSVFLAIAAFIIVDRRLLKQWKVLLSLVVLTAVLCMFSIRKSASSEGRFFILTITFNSAIKDWVTGRGVNSFATQYPLAQGEFFMQNPQSSYFYRADNISYALCEPLQILFEQGILGLCLFSLFFVFCFRDFRKVTIIDRNNNRILLIAILLISLTQSCFRIPQLFLVICIFFIPIITATTKQDIVGNKYCSRLKHFFCVSVLLISILTAIITIAYIQLFNQLGKYTGEQIQRPIADGNSFLAKRSIRYMNLLLAESILYSNDQNTILCLKNLKDLQKSDYLYNLTGKAYLQIGDTTKAIDSYTTAASIVPKRFSNHYSLFTIYKAQGRRSEAVTEALTILKIDSLRPESRINRVKSELYKYLYKNM